jgi:plasmid stabilization system protein ParE
MTDQHFKVLWTAVAVLDLKDIIEYIAADSSLNATNVLNKLKDRVAELDQFPDRGRVVPELAKVGLSGWRELVVKPYRIVYRIDRDSVYILGVLDSRRDLEELLLRRLIRM